MHTSCLLQFLRPSEGRRRTRTARSRLQAQASAGPPRVCQDAFRSRRYLFVAAAVPEHPRCLSIRQREFGGPATPGARSWILAADPEHAGNISPNMFFCRRASGARNSNQWKDIPVGEKIGTMHHFTVPCRTNTTLPEATFQIATPEAVSSGLHAELVFCDDIVNNQTRTIEAHKKAFQNYLDVLPIVQPTGYLFVSGTRYRGGAEPDAYGTHHATHRLLKVEMEIS